MNIFDAMTAPEQEIFDFVLAKIREQGRPSYSPEGGTCYYRGPDGTKCAVGHLIPDEIYSSFMEGMNPWALRHDFVRAAPKSVTAVPRAGWTTFLGGLQLAHDSAAKAQEDGEDFLETFEKNMKHLAEDMELTYSSPE